jgi:hypothetical protein
MSNITSFWIKLIDIERGFYTLHRFEKAHENYSNTHLDKLAIRPRNHRPLPCIHWITLKTKPAYSNIINPEHTTILNPRSVWHTGNATIPTRITGYSPLQLGPGVIYIFFPNFSPLSIPESSRSRSLLMQAGRRKWEAGYRSGAG